MGKTDTGSVGVRPLKRLEVACNRQSCAERKIKSSSFLSSREKEVGFRNPRNDRPKGHLGSAPRNGTINLSGFFKTKKGGRSGKADSKFKGSKFGPGVRAIPDGEVGRPKGHDYKRSVANKGGHQVRVLACANKPGGSKTSSVFVGRKVVPDESSSVRSGASPTSLYQANEDGGWFAEKTGLSASDLLRRPASCFEFKGGSHSGSGLDSPSVQPSWANNQLEEVGTSAGERNGISGVCSEHKRADHKLIRPEGETLDRVSGGDSSEVCFVLERTVSDNWEISGDEAGGSLGNTADKTLAGVADQGATKRTKLGVQGRIEPEFQEGIVVVGKEFAVVGGKSNEIIRPRVDNVFGRGILKGMGRVSVERTFNGRPLDGGPEGAAHKRVGTSGSGVSYQNIHKECQGGAHTYLCGQHLRFGLRGQEGRDQKSVDDIDCEEDLVLRRGTGFPHFSGLDRVGGQCPGGRHVENEPTFIRMDVGQTGVQPIDPVVGYANSGLFCESEHASDRQLLQLQSGPILSGPECSGSELEGTLSISVPSFLSGEQSLEEVAAATDRASHSGSPSLEQSNLVPQTVIDVDRLPQVYHDYAGVADKSLGSGTSAGAGGTLAVGCVPGFRNRLLAGGFSGRAAEILINCRRKSSSRAYQSPWNKWVSWCGQEQVDPYKASPLQVINFLADMFVESGLKYRTLGVYRSAISAFHDQVDGKNLGEHPLISKFMAGVDNLRPPKPKIALSSEIWDVDVVLNHLKSWGPNELLTWYFLNLKLVSILSLVGPREPPTCPC